MAQISQSLNPHPALVLRFSWEPVQPIEHRNSLLVLLVEDNRRLGHQVMFALLRTVVKWARAIQYCRTGEKEK
jgi:hypothetical protein